MGQDVRYETQRSLSLTDREVAHFAIRRWVTLAASTAAAMCCGFYYAWSVLAIPMMDTNGWTSAEVSLAFTIIVAMPAVCTLLAGKLLQYISPRTLLLMGGVVLGAGTILLSFADSLPLLYLFAFVAGVGGMTYPGSTMSNLMTFFPDRRGMASGVLTSGFGMGAILWAPVTVLLLDLIGYQWSLRVLGVLFIIVIALCSRLVTVAPVGYSPRGWPRVTAAVTSDAAAVGATAAGAGATGVTVGAPGVAALDWKAMLCTLRFWLLAPIFVLGLISGLMVTAHASPIAQQMLGISPDAAGAFVSYLALGMVIGKVGWGMLSDRFGRVPVVLTILVLAVVALLVLWQAGSYLPVVGGVFVVGLCYGGFLALIGPVTLDAFGPRHFPVNFGIMFLSVAVGAYAGPRLAATVAEANDGAYEQAFLVAALLTLVALVLATVYATITWRRSASAETN